MSEYHVPVLLDECIDALNIQSEHLYFDGTLGGGGHSYAILKKGGNLIATDRDMQAIDASRLRFSSDSSLNGKYTLVKDNFKNVLQVLSDNHLTGIDGAILDLGLSSHQIDSSDRGFSYSSNALLDMRMDRDQYLSAMTVVNEYTEDELSRIIFTYGEDRFSRRIASAIVTARRKSPIETTKQLADLIKNTVPANMKGGHPAKKTFQAIRIEVNNELGGLGEAISDIMTVLNPGGRICVITFHSLEDRIVKQTFKSMASDCICDKSLPICVCNHKATGKIVNNKGIKPSQEEEKINSRSKSATLRTIEKL